MQEKVGNIPMDADLKWVGTRPIRPDGVDKVTGRARFGADLYLPNMLFGKVLRSPHAHARIRSINTDKAAALPGVLGVWLLRRASYACFATRSAALVGGAQLAAVLAGAALLHAHGGLAPASALLLLGGVNALAALALAAFLGVRPRTAVEPELRRRVLREHWSYGRWMLAGTPFEWIPANFYYLALPSLAGLAAAGICVFGVGPWLLIRYAQQAVQMLPPLPGA